MNPILIIEDEQAMRLLVQEYFEFLGYSVLVAPDGQTALEFVRNQQVSLAFVDINLPDMTGIEVMQEMRNLGATCPLVILSGNLRESYAEQVAHLGISEILEKPVDLNDLEKAVIRHVSGAEDNPAA